jgi:predicted outer membrane protein
MRSASRIFNSLSLMLVITGTVAACGDDDSDSNAQTGDASIYDGGGGGKPSTAGRGGSGGSRATAGRGGSAATAGTSAVAGSGGVPSVTPMAGRGAAAGRGGITPIAGTGADAGVRLSDAQIAAVTSAANSGEIQLGTIALSRAHLEQVLAFAQEMITMHGAAQDRSLALLQSLNLTPVENNLSTQLAQDAQRTGVMLQNAAAADFDLLYVQSQIDIHTQVLQIFDDILLPSVTDAALRTDLSLARADVQRHLAEAQALLLVVRAAPALDSDGGVEDAGL